MPTFEDRTHTWTLTSLPNQKIAIIIVSVCTFVLLTIMVTVFIHRKDVAIRMFHYLHIISFCLAAVIFSWALVLLWPADTRSSQCRSYLWLTYLPASFMISINNMKAYRLSVFITSNKDGLRPRPFSHGKVLKYTMFILLTTVVLLLISALIDPPTRTRVIVDIYRPRLNYYVCQTGTATPAILYVIVVSHFMFSLYCIAAVRNGLEDFRDGMIIKEAFVLFYASIVIVLVLSNLGIDAHSLYVLRVGFLSVGATLFCLRLMINRCAKYWLPGSVLALIKRIEIYWKEQRRVHLSHHSSMDFDVLIGNEEPSKRYLETSVCEENVLEMLSALRNPERYLYLYIYVCIHI
jgi:hypothetical protein